MTLLIITVKRRVLCYINERNALCVFSSRIGVNNIFLGKQLVKLLFWNPEMMEYIVWVPNSKNH